MTGDDVPTLYEWAGGLEALERLTAIFYDRVKQDALLGPVFAGMDAHHPQYVARFLAEVFGGPSLYSDERGGHAHMGEPAFESPVHRGAAASMDLDAD